MSFELVSLSDIADVIDSLHKTPKYADKGWAMVRCTDVSYGYLELESTFKVEEIVYNEFSRRYKPEKNDLIITRVGSYGLTALVDDTEFCLGQNTSAIKPKINAKYLYLCLNSSFVQRQIESKVVGTTQKTLSLKAIKSLLIPRFGDYKEDCIADIGWNLNDKIYANRRINHTLEQMAQALFKSWFVDFEPVKAKIAVLESGGSQEEATLAAMTAISGKDADSLTIFEQEHPEKYAELRATAELFPSTMQESELGDIPAGWSSQRMSNIATLHYGKALKKTERIDGPYPVYGSGGVTGSHNGYLVEGPGIIVGRKGSIGTIYWEDGKFHPIDTVYYVATKEEIPLSYLYYLMKTLNLPSMNTDAAVPGLNRDNVYRLEVLKPTQSILNRFDNHIATIRNGIQKNNNTIVSLVGLRDTLLPKLLSGEITLPEAEELAKEADYV
ncbi:type I restriction endonuclease [Klebsiella pneumoniae]|uniref:restriction endonuclease subunit S n=1 Tax=Klebsiella TaxID=570 RepID=UPI001C7F12A7|nr:restriction endonuclease subunit S [Klebsiella pneumoniae]MBX4515670.1 type I restriction endonuclease [Klebsiella pneumoniae]MBX4557534.1 type I restriction endonuclease [Klebsiella pneumoniae]